MAGGHRLQIVDVIDEQAVELAKLGIDVARYGDVDEEHWPVAAALQEQLSVLATEDRVRRAGRGNHNISTVHSVIELVEGDGVAVELQGQLLGAFGAAIGHVNLAGAMCDQMVRRQLAHLASAYQVDGTILQGTEDLLGQFHCH
jgi:hypothetical protein